MPKLFPLPSPNRTNYEKLYQPPLGSAAAAYDAAQRRRANDAIDPDALKQSVDNLTGHLGATLQGDDLTTAYSLLSAVLNLAVPADDPDDSDDDEASDRRRKMAGDRKRVAARMSYEAQRLANEKISKRFPNAIAPYQYGPLPRR
jgi:hypothetical protein